MKKSSFVCQQCGSYNVRKSHGDSKLDRVRMAVGNYPLRCDDCHHRFWTNIFLLSKVLFARCPRCLSFTLTSWNPRNYHLPPWRKLLLKLGGHRYRCDACRCNFISFRARLSPKVQPVAQGESTVKQSN